MPRILLVEDDADLSDTLADWFECHGYTVETAFTGPDALSGMQSSRYDLIVLDWQLPDMAGVDVLSKYRAAGGKDLVLMLTGNRDMTARQAGLAAGANDFLAKPFNLDQLAKRLDQLLKST